MALEPQSFRVNRDLFSNYYLDEHLPETEEWEQVGEEVLEEARQEILELWNQERETVEKTNESQLERRFIRPMFDKLGIPFEVEESVSRTQRRPDYGFFETDDAARNAFDRREEGGDFYDNAVAVADAKRWDRPLDTRGSGEHQRDFENPSYQIHVYLQETPVRWAVLTNGRKWRLYYGPTSHRLDSYYEIDLPTILEDGDLADFKYFYLFFRHEAFVEDARGDAFLDDVYDESNVFARELGEDLQNNIYDAIKILSEGFLQYPENDLTEDDLKLIHDSSLIYLYRLIFVLYAEAEGRDLLDTDNEIYEVSYSLNALKQEIAEELDSADPKYRDWQTNLWYRLDELFRLIDQGSKSRGIPEDDLHIPAYDGGLFRTSPDEDDSPEARFLDDHEVGDAYLAEVIDLLARSRNGNGGGKIFVDYSSLDVRHLGSIYEGLLEYQLNVADEPLALDDGEYVAAEEGDAVVVDAGDIYLTTDSGERKATGSYYTPEYIVEYIVQNTLGPLVEEIREDLVGYDSNEEGGFADEFAERVFELKVLDPAMGSGHFLTSAVDYLAREIIDAQERQAVQRGIETIDEDHDINWARRQVAQRCIYGVDLNPLAVELAKVALWLRTLAAEQPLAFLDHHLKTGNSLVGSDIEEIEQLESDSAANGPNASLADFGVTRKGTMEQLMTIYEDFVAIENRELAEMKEIEAKYDEFERNELRRRLEAMANVHTARRFGLDSLPRDAFEKMAAALEHEDSWSSISQKQWFLEAQWLAANRRFFHWKLEYPEVFYDKDGSSRDDPGFDVVLGNPPWLGVRTGTIDSEIVSYLRSQFSAAEGQFDLAAVFLEHGTKVLRSNGPIGFVVPKRIASNEIYEDLRHLLAVDRTLTAAIDVGLAFEEVNQDAMILISDTPTTSESLRLGHRVGERELEFRLVSSDTIGQLPYNIVPVNSTDREVDLAIQIDQTGDFHFGKVSEITRGAECGMNHDAISKDQTERSLPAVDPSEVGPYGITGDTYYIDTTKIDDDVLKDWSIYQTAPKLLARFLSDRLIVARDETGFASTNLVYHIETDAIDFYCGLLNSNLLSFWYMTAFQTVEEVYPHVQKSHLQAVPVVEPPATDSSKDHKDGRADHIDGLPEDRVRMDTEDLKRAIPGLVDEIVDRIAERDTLNVDILDYLGIPPDGDVAGPELVELPGYNPPSGVSESPLVKTTEELKNLRFGEVFAERKGDMVLIKATSRYKPKNASEDETDQWGYVETDQFAAMEFRGLDDDTAALLETFVPRVCEEAGGFAGFRDEARKNISLQDRLEAIRLPELESIPDGLDRYVAVYERAQQLDTEIDEIDQQINDIVYQLYGLSDEDIEIVESVLEDD